jgi:hypothetical protein
VFAHLREQVAQPVVLFVQTADLGDSSSD